MSLSSEIAHALSSHNVLLSAEPGAGKSTALPLALLLSNHVSGKILLLEPRRLAARSVAQRLANHLGENVGEQIGLRMRSDTRVSKETRLTVVTEGVLTRILQNDPTLDEVGLIIFDEFHERSLHADLGLALCMDVQQALREDLRLLFMSATLETKRLNHQLQKVEMFHCSVRQHPVETIWVGEQSTPLEQQVTQSILAAIADQEGDILVFLPGVAEINRCARLLSPKLDPSIQLHLLHSGVSTSDQAKACAPASVGIRRIILATSLAETSITIDGVLVVIDSGLERRSRVDNSTGSERLETVKASQASATQRAGRAGRTAPGVCYRLWGEAGHSRRAAHWQPEIFRADLSPLLLDLGLWGATGKNDLPWLDAPPAAELSRAEALLSRLGLWRQGGITQEGKLVADLAVHPRIGHMLNWASRVGNVPLACRIAVLLEESSRKFNTVDLEPSVNDSLSASLRRRANILERKLPVHHSAAHSPSAAVLLAQAYPDWIAQRRPGKQGEYQLACGVGVFMNSDEALAHCPWLVIANLGGSGNQLRIFKALALDINELHQYVPELFNVEDHLDWDSRQERVIAERRTVIDHLVVETKPIVDLNNDEKTKALIVGIRKLGLACLPWNTDCREWQARVERMSHLNLPVQQDQWPNANDATLLVQLERWLQPWLSGVGSIKALQQIDLISALKSLLTYQQQALMDEWLPRKYTVPSGSNISLSYISSGNPTLSVRLQEMLGCAVNPTIAKGQIPLKVELLSPASRPVQVTTDLANFWDNSYPAVKKDLAGRYPKHEWPDDPLSAKPTAYAKRRKKPAKR